VPKLSSVGCIHASSCSYGNRYQSHDSNRSSSDDFFATMPRSLENRSTVYSKSPLRLRLHRVPSMIQAGPHATHLTYSSAARKSQSVRQKSMVTVTTFQPRAARRPYSCSLADPTTRFIALGGSAGDAPRSGVADDLPTQHAFGCVLHQMQAF
jgi:hypothetical protein